METFSRLVLPLKANRNKIYGNYFLSLQSGVLSNDREARNTILA